MGFRHFQHTAAAFPHLGLHLPILVPGAADVPDQPSLAEQERGQERGVGRAGAACHQLAPELSHTPQIKTLKQPGNIQFHGN